jgi:hypothetical protein
MTSASLVIDANTPEDVRDFLAKHLREQASIRRRQAKLGKIKSDQRSHERLAENLDFIASQLERAVIFPKITT